MQLRIIGGKYRGRKLVYSGDRRVRPMKDRVREAIFNLIGPLGKERKKKKDRAARDWEARDTEFAQNLTAVDLFAGTGALGLEALSRGVGRALFFEQHIPTAAIIRQNVAGLGVEERCEIHTGDTFLAFRLGQSLPTEPVIAFVSPPYELWISRQADMLWLVEWLIDHAAEGSRIVVESDERFDFALLPRTDAWIDRIYLPAHVGILTVNKTGAHTP